MRRPIGIVIGSAALVLATTAMAQSPPPSNGSSPPGDPGPGVRVDRQEPIPTRYETSLGRLKAQMDKQTRLDGGHLTPVHEAEFQQALDDTNRHFHKGPYARP
jgi:hypothetical protein